MHNKNFVYLLRKAAKHLQADDQQELAQAVKEAADHAEEQLAARKESMAVKHKNLASVGRSGNHLTGLVGALKSNL